MPELVFYIDSVVLRENNLILISDNICWTCKAFWKKKSVREQFIPMMNVCKLMTRTADLLQKPQLTSIWILRIFHGRHHVLKTNTFFSVISLNVTAYIHHYACAFLCTLNKKSQVRNVGIALDASIGIRRCQRGFWIASQTRD